MSGELVIWETSSGQVWRAILAGGSRRKVVPNQLVARAGSGLGVLEVFIMWECLL